MTLVVRVSDRVTAAVQKVFRERCDKDDHVEFEVHIQPVRAEEGDEREHEMTIFVWAALDCPETESLSTAMVLLELNHALLHEGFIEEAVNEIWESLSSQRMVHAAGLTDTEA